MRDDKNGLTHVFVAMGAIAFFCSGCSRARCNGNVCSKLVWAKICKVKP